MKHYSQYLRGEILTCFTLLNKFICRKNKEKETNILQICPNLKLNSCFYTKI